MPQMTGIGNITVEKSKLLAILRANRAKHHETFEQAVAVFQERATAELERLLARVKAGERPAMLMVALPIPEEHLEDFDRSIGMLEMAIEDTITLTESTYMMLVENEWGWARSFAANTTSYVADTGRF